MLCYKNDASITKNLSHTDIANYKLFSIDKTEIDRLKLDGDGDMANSIQQEIFENANVGKKKSD